MGLAIADDDHKKAAARVVKTQTEVANHFGVNRKTVCDWKAAGMPLTRHKKPQYSLPAIQKWLEQTGKGKQPQQQTGAKQSLNELRAQILQIKLDRELGQLVETKVVVNIGRRQITEARQVLDELPVQLVSCLPDETEHVVRESVRKHAERAVRNVQEALATVLEDLALAIDDGELI